MKKTLKFLSWMFVAVLSVLSFSSCSDDDEGLPYAGTVWEYEDIYESGTITTRIRFADETKAYYEVEQRNAGGTIVDNTSSPYSYTYSGTLIVFRPQQTGKANLEGVVSEGVKMVLTNTSNGEEISILYKK